MSHEVPFLFFSCIIKLFQIRTPLSGIIGMSQILTESGLTMDQMESVATIQNCGETLLAVINSILDYTKLEASGNAHYRNIPNTDVYS